eukprot:4916866-Amphidinium_carterae.8
MASEIKTSNEDIAFLEIEPPTRKVGTWQAQDIGAGTNVSYFQAQGGIYKLGLRAQSIGFPDAVRIGWQHVHLCCYLHRRNVRSALAAICWLGKLKITTDNIGHEGCNALLFCCKLQEVCVAFKDVGQRDAGIGGMKCWGSASDGQLGYQDMANRGSAVCCTGKHHSIGEVHLSYKLCHPEWYIRPEILADWRYFIHLRKASTLWHELNSHLDCWLEVQAHKRELVLASSLFTIVRITVIFLIVPSWGTVLSSLRQNDVSLWDVFGHDVVSYGRCGVYLGSCFEALWRSISSSVGSVVGMHFLELIPTVYLSC